MIFFMFVDNGIVVSKGYGEKKPTSAIAISSEQYAKDIILLKVESPPVYNSDGVVLVDAKLKKLGE